MFDSIEIDRQTIQRAVTYTLPTTLVLYGLIIMFVPLNFPTGIDFLFGNTDSRSSFTTANYALLLAVLLMDAVVAVRYRAVAVAGVVTLVHAIPLLIYPGYGNDGKVLFAISILLFVSSVILYREN